jgi:hypothetical protein
MAAPRTPLTLSQRVLGYPESAPQTLMGLVDATADFIKDLDEDPEAIEVALDLRRDVIHVITGHERTALTSPEVVLELLSTRVIRPLPNRWITYALDKERKRRLVANPTNPTEMSYARIITRTPPRHQYLQSDLPLTEGGIYLVIFGSGPEVLSQDGTAEKVADLLSGAEVADVLFWKTDPKTAPTLFSLRRGQGDRSREAVPFPDPQALAIASSPARNSVAHSSSGSAHEQGGSLQ